MLIREEAHIAPMEIAQQRGSSSRHRWVVLFTSLLAFVAYAFAFQVAPPLIPSIVNEFGITNAEAGLIMAIVVFPAIFLSLPAGLFVRRYGAKQVGFSSLCGVALGSLMVAMANSYMMVLFGRLILGLGATFVVVATSAAISEWFAKEDLGKAMGIFGMNMPLSTIIAFLTASATASSYGWRFIFYVSFALGAVATSLFVLLKKGGPFAKRETTNAFRAVRVVEVWKVGFVWLFFNAAVLSFSTWAPTLFKTFLDMPEVLGSSLASVVMVAAIFCVPVYGYFSDRTGKRKIFVLVGFLLMALGYAAIAFTSNVLLIVSISFLGVAASMIPAIVTALPAEILGSNMSSIGFGITAMFANIGIALTQPLVGYLLDVTQSYMLCMFTMAALAVMGMVSASTLKTK